MNYQVGDIVTGKVTSIKPYGAFIALTNNMSGLLHISEISHRYVKDVDSVLKVGEKIKVKIVSIDYAKNHIVFTRKNLYKSKRRTKDKGIYNKEKIMETKKGFSGLEKMLPIWIAEYKGEHNND